MAEIEEQDGLICKIKSMPHTYKTILGHNPGNTTENLILRRKMNKLCRNGSIMKTNIPGTRFGEAIFFHPSKEYYVLIESTRIKSVVRCFFDFRKSGNMCIEVDEHYFIEGCEWKKINKPVKFFEGSILKFF